MILVRETARILRELNPYFWNVENVQGSGTPYLQSLRAASAMAKRTASGRAAATSLMSWILPMCKQVPQVGKSGTAEVQDGGTNVQSTETARDDPRALAEAVHRAVCPKGDRSP